jgi:hypothetical protein
MVAFVLPVFVTAYGDDYVIVVTKKLDKVLDHGHSFFGGAYGVFFTLISSNARWSGTADASTRSIGRETSSKREWE